MNVHMYTLKKYRRNMMTRSLKDIYDYEQEALASIQTHYPAYDRNEIESLLIEQINDELRDYANTRTNRGTS